MRKFLLILVLLFATLFAEDIDRKMQQIREASPQERVKLMNALKREIAAMNRTQRDKAIASLRIKMGAKMEQSQSIQKGEFRNLQRNMQSLESKQEEMGLELMRSQERFKMKFLEQ